ncbi:MAG TPA: cytochrome c3 family protein [Candidatus Kryptonia bacterium]|nr:cytochrome c3 family protein [Candidatus Kryptonia bacterium]
MSERNCGARAQTRPIWVALAFLGLLMPFSVARAKSSQGEDVHRSEAACGTCHTTSREALQGNRDAARGMVAPDLETRCTACHNEGPSHLTGIPAKKAVPDTLHLSAQGLITCATCHFMHSEPNPYTDFLRIDNSRGALCLTCHELSELQ